MDNPKPPVFLLIGSMTVLILALFGCLIAKIYDGEPSHGEVATWTSALTSLAVGMVTVWMALTTQRMAKIADDALSIDRSPVLGIRTLRVELFMPPGATAWHGISIGIELFHAGRVVVYHRLKSLDLNLSNGNPSGATYLSRRGRVLPGNSLHFRSHRVPLIAPSLYTTGRLTCVFEYSATPDYADVQEFGSTFEITADGRSGTNLFAYTEINE